MAYKTTQKHFDLFVKEAKGFIDLFGLKDWRIEFEFGVDNEGYARAQCVHSYDDGQWAVLRLAKKWDIVPTSTQIRENAFHEVCHVLLTDSLNIRLYDDLSPSQTQKALDRAHHAVIRRLENAFLGGE